MAAPVGLLALVLAAMLIERAAEVELDRRHRAWLRARGAAFEARDGFALVLAGQVALFGGLALEGSLAPWTRVGAWTWFSLAAVALAQGARYWAVATLGRRWTMRVATLPGAARVASGPYRWLRHPNYAAVALEALALPLAFAAWGTLLLAGALIGVALARRLAIEERALAAAARTVDVSPPGATPSGESTEIA